MRRLLMGTQNGATESSPAISPTSPASPPPKNWFGLTAPHTLNGIKYKSSLTGNHIARSTAAPDHDKLPFAADRLVARNSGENGSNFSHSPSHPPPQHDRITAFEESDSLMVELLSGQAVVEAKEYGILQWDEMADLKKEHETLAGRIATLSRSCALETRLRDTAAKLIRLSDPSSTRSPTSPSRQQQLSREKATAQLAQAEARLATIQVELHRIGWKDSELQRKLLQHTAAVLALALRRREDQEQGILLSPLPTSSSDPLRPRDITQARVVSPNSRTTEQFEGHHFFAGNKEAIVPLPRSSPFSSPSQLNASTFSPLAIEPPHYANEITALKTTNTTLLAQLSHLKSDSLHSRRTSDTSQSLIAELRSEVTTSHALLMELRRELTETTNAFSESQEAEAETQRELDELQREVKEARRDVMDARNGKGEQAREVGEAVQRAQVADERVAKLERETEEEQSTSRDEMMRLRENLELAESERSQITQSIASVLNHHRSRSTLLRDLPTLDDSTNRPDLAHYISTTLDSHFDSLTSHITTLDRTILALQSDSSKSTTMQDELATAVTERENLRKEMEESIADRGRLESAHEELRTTHSTLLAAHDQLQSTSTSPESLAEKESQLANLSAEISSARQEITHLTTELTNLSATNSHLDEELLQTKKQHSKSLSMLKTFEAEMGTQRGEAERAKSVLADRNEDLQKYQNTIQELEERAEVAATQEVAMLERLNEFTVILEQTRSEKRKVEAHSSSTTAALKTVEAEKATLSASLSTAQTDLAKAQSELTAALARPDDLQKLSALEDELQELRDTISDLEEELSDAKTRETGTRSKLMEELHGVQLEVSGLKTALRQEQRKRPVVPTK